MKTVRFQLAGTHPKPVLKKTEEGHTSDHIADSRSSQASQPVADSSDSVSPFGKHSANMQLLRAIEYESVNPKAACRLPSASSSAVGVGSGFSVEGLRRETFRGVDVLTKTKRMSEISEGIIPRHTCVKSAGLLPEKRLWEALLLRCFISEIQRKQAEVPS